MVEGVGDHGCEYMTGGALILGPTGATSQRVCPAASPTSMIPRCFPLNCNMELVDLHKIDDEDEELVHRLIVEHEAHWIHIAKAN